MPICQCGATLEGRRRKCDACKAGPRRTGPAPAPDPVVEVVDTTPAGLRDRGRQLWTDLGLTLSTPAGQLALEACRMADRLDELDSVIAGKGVLHLMAFRLHIDLDREDLEVTVNFQNVLAEARQQQSTFRALLAEIHGQVKATSPSAPPAPAPTAGASSPLDELTRRRQGKKAK